MFFRKLSTERVLWKYFYKLVNYRMWFKRFIRSLEQSENDPASFYTILLVHSIYDEYFIFQKATHESSWNDLHKFHTFAVGKCAFVCWIFIGSEETILASYMFYLLYLEGGCERSSKIGNKISFFSRATLLCSSRKPKPGKQLRLSINVYILKQQLTAFTIYDFRKAGNKF